MSYYEAGEIYDLKKEIIQLRQKPKKAKEVLEFYAHGQHIGSTSIGSSYSISVEDGTKAKEVLRECGEA